MEGTTLTRVVPTAPLDHGLPDPVLPHPVLKATGFCLPTAAWPASFAASLWRQKAKVTRIEYLNVLRLNQTNATTIVRLGESFHAERAYAQPAPLLVRTVELQPENLLAVAPRKRPETPAGRRPFPSRDGL